MFTVRVPATSANLGPGFDTLGLALDLFLEVTIDYSAAINTEVVFYGEGGEVIQEKPENNLIIAAMKRVFQEAELEMPGLKMLIQNKIPVGKGLGSSAAAIVAGMYCANYLLEQRFSREQLIKWAVQLEGHADNIVPAVVGGLTTVMLYDGEVYFQKMELPDIIKIIVAVPDFTLATEKSRSVLPKQVDLQDTVANLQRACFLLSSIYNNDFNNINKAMDDRIYQAMRKQFIPGFEQILIKAKESGALGAALSGAGPSIVALGLENEKLIGQAMQEVFRINGIESRIFYLKANKSGVECFRK